jgi:hypothetical protein
MEVAAQASQNVGKCKRAARGDEEKQRDEDFAAPQQRQHFTVELHEAFAGQLPVRAGSGHDEEDGGGKKDDCAQKTRRNGQG